MHIIEVIILHYFWVGENEPIQFIKKIQCHKIWKLQFKMCVWLFSYKKSKKQHFFGIFSSLFGTFQVGNISKNVYFKNHFWHFLANFKAVCTRIKKRVGEFISMAKILRKQRAEQLVLKDIMQKYWRTLIMIDWWCSFSRLLNRPVRLWILRFYVTSQSHGG